MSRTKKISDSGRTVRGTALPAADYAREARRKQVAKTPYTPRFISAFGDREVRTNEHTAPQKYSDRHLRSANREGSSPPTGCDSFNLPENQKF